MRSKFFFSVTVLSALALAGCKVTVNQATNLSCTATPAAVTIEANTPVSVAVAAAGGTAPYSIIGQIGTFASSSSVSRSYANSTGADKIYDDVVAINDSTGLTAQCGFSVTVHTSVVTPVTPTVSVVSSPSTTVIVGSSITLNATSTGLGATPTYTFTYAAAANISKVQTGAQAVFSLTNTTATEFDVVVTGTGNSQTASATVHLSFTAAAAGSMACSIAHDKSYAAINEAVTFTVAASTGEDIQILEFLPGTSGTVTNTVNGAVTVKFTSIGTKTISVRAKAKNRNVICNNNIPTLDSVVIRNALSCTAYADDTQYRVYYGASAPAWDGYMYNSAIVWAVVPSDAGAGTPSITQISSIPTVSGTYQPYNSNPLAKEVFFYNSGTVKLELTVTDGSGATAKCQTSNLNVYY